MKINENDYGDAFLFAKIVEFLLRWINCADDYGFDSQMYRLNAI